MRDEMVEPEASSVTAKAACGASLRLPIKRSLC